MTALLRSVKFFGSGSVPRLKSPFPLQCIEITSHPKCSNTNGRASEPAPFTASITTLNFRFRIAFRSIQDNSTVSIECFKIEFWSGKRIPVCSAFSIGESASTNLNSASQSSGWKKVPSARTNLRPFHSMGLWLAVMMVPPAASDRSTINWTVGVGTIPHTITSLPTRINSSVNASNKSSPDGRLSRPRKIKPGATCVWKARA